MSVRTTLSNANWAAFMAGRYYSIVNENIELARRTNGAMRCVWVKAARDANHHMIEFLRRARDPA